MRFHRNWIGGLGTTGLGGLGTVLRDIDKTIRKCNTFYIMPRSPRFIFQNAFYHVFNRGTNKQDIFLSDNDYKFFIKKIKDLKKKYDHSVYAFCLMPNHFHISIQTRKAPISKIMASLITSYSMYFNRTHKHLGSVFQNRFKSILIENDSYFLKLSQYIYLNPVKTGLISDPLLYRYSSIREALGKEPRSILDEDVIRLVGETLVGETKNSLKEYETFIYDGLKEDFTEIEQLFQKEEATLGTSRFSIRSQRKYLRRRSKKYA